MNHPSFPDLSLQDSGNYTCEVRGRQSTILGQVTHQIFVRGKYDNTACLVHSICFRCHGLCFSNVAKSSH